MIDIRFLISGASVLGFIVSLSMFLGYTRASNLPVLRYILANILLLGSFVLAAYQNVLPPVLGSASPGVIALTGLILSALVAEEVVLGRNRTRWLFLLVPLHAVLTLLFTFFIVDEALRILLTSLFLYTVCVVTIILFFLPRRQYRSRSSSIFIILYAAYGLTHLVRGTLIYMSRSERGEVIQDLVLSGSILIMGYVFQLLFSISTAQMQQYEQIKALEQESQRRISLLPVLNGLHERTRGMGIDLQPRAFDALFAFLSREFKVSSCLLFHSREGSAQWHLERHSGISRLLCERDDLQDILYVASTAKIGEPLELSLEDYPLEEYRDLLFSEGWYFFSVYPMNFTDNSKSVLVTSWSDENPDKESRLLMRAVSGQSTIIMENTMTISRLRTELSRYRTFFSLSFEPVIVFSRMGRIEEVNVNACKLLEHDLSNLMDLAPGELIVKKDRHRFLAMLSNLDPGSTESGIFELMTGHPGPISMRFDLRLVDSGGRDSVMAVISSSDKRS